jgi:SAM-dependent methyltransferase
MTSRSKQVSTMIRSEGLLRTCSHALGYLLELASDTVQDFRLGIRTTRRESPTALGIDNPCSEKYAPSDYRSLRAVLRELELHAGRDAFLDYGSGKGRVLIMAAGMPFRRVVGIELSADLNRLAQRNLRRARRHLRCSQIEILQADAASFEVPDDITVAYFYSPFTGETLRGALDQLHASWRRRPRQLRILFKDPADFEREVAGHGWLERVRSWGDDASHARRRYVLYRSREP